MMSPLSSDPRSSVPAVDGVRQQPADARDPGPAGGTAAPGQDRVEISAAARAQAGAQAGPTTGAADPDVEAARVALRSESDLGPARLHELRERVRTGYYDQPGAVDRIAGAVTDDVTGADRP